MKKVLLLAILGTLAFCDDSSIELENKSKLTNDQIKNKKAGSYFTGLPLINYDPDKGLGYGARVYWFDNGDKEDKLFDYTPFRHKVYAQFFQTTNGWSYDVLNYEAPYIADTNFKLTAQAIYEKNTQARYFGVNSSSLNNLSAPDGSTFLTASAQQDYLDANGSSFYNRYFLEKPKVEINLEYDLFGGLARIAFGYNMSYANIKTYNDKKVADKHNDKSQLYDDNQKNAVTGFNGGFDSGIKIGFIYDSRDFAPNPKNGSAHDFTAEFYSKYLGSDYDHQRYTFSTKNFLTLDSVDFATFAFRWIYSVQQGDTPFYEKNVLSYTDTFIEGLGGLRTLRGYQQNRFVADVKTVANIETRFNFLQTATLGQTFEFMFVPFVDAGSVFDKVSDTSFNNIKYTYGAGMRIAWNQATVIMVDYGKSSEDSGLYINFNHIF